MKGQCYFILMAIPTDFPLYGITDENNVPISMEVETCKGRLTLLVEFSPEAAENTLNYLLYIGKSESVIFRTRHVKLFSLFDLNQFKQLHDFNSKIDSLGFCRLSYEETNTGVIIGKAIFTPWLEVFCNLNY